MNIQVFISKKCQDSRKAERFFKERRIAVHYIDLAVRGLSKGELAKVQAVVGLEALVDKEGKEYKRLNLKYMVHNIEELLLENPKLLSTPIARCGSKSTVGYCPDVWEEWLKQNQS